jgi:hypothetical protein
MMTISRRPSVGARHCSTYARKVGPFIAPSMTNRATIPSCRKPATKVIVFQCPWGTSETSCSPRRQRPLSPTMLVLVAVSYQPGGIKHALLSYPASACASDIGSLLLFRVQAFF